MKKILAKLAQGELEDASNSHSNTGNSATHGASFIGRHFKIGHFSLAVDDVIAEGGFGTVFRVRSRQGQFYALKRTCVNYEHDLNVCKREITIVSSLSHKNILRYIDSRINRLEDGIFEVLLLTAYYPGSLSLLLNERHQCQQRLTEVEVMRVFCDVCEAVCRLHHCKTPVIHRDLKVENVLIDSRQNFVLCDFGSATSRVLHPGVHGLLRCQEEIDRYTTLAYRAPEMVNLHSSIPLGLQIDIWALGCLLYFLCFTTLPFGESSLAIQSGNYSIPDSSPYSDRLHKLIGYLLCVDATKRPDIFQTCALAFSITGRPNPAQNLDNMPVPHWQDLTLPSRESQLKVLRHRPSAAQPLPHSPACSSSPSSQAAVPEDRLPSTVANTSIAPRQRPRAARSHLGTTASSQLAIPEEHPVPLKPPPTAGRMPSQQQLQILQQVVENSNHPLSLSTEANTSVNAVTGWQPAFKTAIPETEQSAWSADFDHGPPFRSVSVPSHPQRPPSAINALGSGASFVFDKGHHRTWSADVDYTFRSTQTTAFPTFSSNCDPDHTNR
ncbi:unnamed protein product, partial [Dicrocoelium dendriticum]